MIDALRLTHEHDLQLLLVRVVVNVLSKFCVDRISLYRDIHGNSLLDIDELLLVLCLQLFNIRFKSTYVLFQSAHLLEQLETQLVGLEAPLLELQYVVRRRLDLPLKVALSLQAALVVAFEFRNFLHKHIDVRLLIIAHLLKFSDVITLVCTDLF